jgi:hypothetical protein
VVREVVRVVVRVVVPYVTRRVVRCVVRCVVLQLPWCVLRGVPFVVPPRAVPARGGTDEVLLVVPVATRRALRHSMRPLVWPRTRRVT